MQPDTVTEAEETEKRFCAFCGKDLADTYIVIKGLCANCARYQYGE